MFRKKFEKNAIDAGSPTNFAVAPEKYVKFLQLENY